MIPLALAFHDANGLYATFAAATLRSVLVRTSETIHIYILHDDTLFHGGKRVLEKVSSCFGQTISFHQVPDNLALPKKIPDSLGRGSFYRYLLPELAELSDINRVLYLDCDICAMLDIAELWQEANAALDTTSSVRPPAIALVPDVSSHVQIPRLKALDIDPRFYPNSGVMVMDLARLRTYVPNLLKALVGVASRTPQLMLWPDQDALGILIKRLPHIWIEERFNYQIHIAERWKTPPEHLEGKLVHYCARKPWCDPLYEAGKAFMEHHKIITGFLE